MKILYDNQIFNQQRIGGISRYFYELMICNMTEPYELAISYSENEYLCKNNKFNVVSRSNSYEKFLPNINFKGKRRLFNYYQKLFRIDNNPNLTIACTKLKNQDFDVFHPTYYDSYFLNFIKDKPFVLTIHDMIHEKLPELFPLNTMELQNKKELAKKASHIIAISEYTKKDIIDTYDISPDKITTIYHGSSLLSKTAIFSSNFIEITQKRYFLFTGNRNSYKNFYFFIESISELLKTDKDLYIVCTANDFTKAEKTFFEQLNILTQVIHIYATDSELSALYSNALAFVFPSYYEGFGIPILEAFEAKCPLILANTTCFPEIACNAALYFDPKSKSEILNCCKKVLQSEILRKELITKGTERLSHFSWEKTTQQTLEVYKNCIKNS